MASGGDLDGGATDVDVASVGWRLVVANVVGVAVAKLADHSITPAAHPTPHQQRAGVILLTPSELDDVAPDVHIAS